VVLTPRRLADLCPHYLILRIRRRRRHCHLKQLG